jgi:hypothetical protein
MSTQPREIPILVEHGGVYSLPPADKGRWRRRWTIYGDELTEYTVAQDASGQFGCSCPRWKFKREQCKHIDRLKTWLDTATFWVEYATRPGYWHSVTAHKSVDEAKAKALELRKLRHKRVRLVEKHWRSTRLEAA